MGVAMCLGVTKYMGVYLLEEPVVPSFGAWFGGCPRNWHIPFGGTIYQWGEGMGQYKTMRAGTGQWERLVQPILAGRLKLCVCPCHQAHSSIQMMGEDWHQNVLQGSRGAG